MKHFFEGAKTGFIFMAIGFILLLILLNFV